MRLGLGLGLVRLGKAIASFVRDGLKLYYPFKDNSPELLLSGATSFDGDNDYIDCGSDSSLDNIWNGGGTISTWFFPKSDGEGNEGRIIEKRDDGSGWVLHMREESSGTSKLKFYINYSSQAGQFTTNNDVIINQWNHVAVIYDTSGAGSSYRPTIYINGSITSFSATIDTSGSVSSDASESLVIGNVKTSLNRAFDGSIANVGIWNRALSASEIESIYWKGQYADLKGTELTNLVSWYNLKETGFGSDVVTNGDLWTGASGSTRPNNWSSSGVGTPTHTIVDLSSVANFDSTTLRFSCTGVRNIYQQNALSGVRYKVEFAYRTDSSSNYIYIGNSGNQIALSNTGLSGDATLVSQEIDSNGIGIGIQIITSDSTIEISNINLYPVSAPDSKGTNNGTIVGATTLTDAYSASSPFLPRIQDKATPKGAVALASGSTSFDGSDDYIDTGITPRALIGNSNPFTVSAWAKANDDDNEYIIGSMESGAERFYLRFRDPSGGTAYLRWGYGGTGDSNTDAVVTLNTWHHVAWTYDSSSAKLYVDGSLKNTQSISGQTISNTDNLFIGAININGTASNFFNGSLANVAIYSDVKTQSEIQDIMFSSYSTLTSALKTNLVSWYDLGSTPIEAGSNLSTNGNFDSNTTGWSAVRASLSSITGGQSGNCLAVTRDSGSDQSAYQSFSVTNGKTYRLKVYIKSGSSGDESFHIQLTSGSDFGRTEGISSGEWVAYTLDYTATASTMSIVLRKNSSTAGTMLFDTVSVKEIQATDSQGDNEGSIYGATTNTGYTSSPSGVADPLNYGEVYGGNAVSFDGTNDYISVADNDSLSFGDGSNDSAFSISAWINMDDATKFRIASKCAFDGSSLMEYTFTTSGSDALLLQLFDATTGNNIAGFGSTLTSSQGKWIHVACTYDASESASGIKIYVDGSDVTASTSTDGTYVAMHNTTAELELGRLRSGSGTTTYSDGKINNVKVFNTALTQDQVRELYTKPELTLPTGIASSALKLDMPMQEGSGVAILDGSPTFLDVAINGDFSADAVGSTSVTGWSLDDFTAEVIADGYTGNAVQLTRTDSGTQSFYQDLSGITSGNEYKINAKLKAIGGSVSAGIRVTTPTDSNPSSNIVSLPADGSWQDLELSFTAQGTTARIQIQRQESDPGSIVVDDVIINQLNLGQNHGTGSGITWANGQEYGFQHPLVRSNNPMVFDGSDDFVATGTTFNHVNHTISAWVNANITTSSDRIIFDARDSGSDGILLYIRGDNNKIGYQLNSTALTTSLAYDAQDIHVIASYDGSTQKTYINGSLVASQSTSLTTSTTTNAVIGARNFSSQASFFGGRINEVAVWDSALTANEVTALYNSGLPLLPTTDSGNYASTDDLAGYWRNDGVTTWLDRSTNSNNGTVSGSPASIIVPEGLNEGRDSQGYYLTDTDSISSGIRFKGAEYISVQDSESLDYTGSFTIGYWVKPSSLTNNDRMITKGTTGTGEWMISIGGGDKIRVYAKDNNDNVKDFTSANALVIGSWSYVTVVINKSNNSVDVYKDGGNLSQGTSAGWDASFSTSVNLRIGVNSSGSGFFNGSIDEVKIYDKALSATEVLKNYNNGKSAHSN